MPNTKSFCAALIAALAIPSALPAFWHDGQPIPKSTITTGEMQIEGDYLKFPNWIKNTPVLMRGLQDDAYREFLTTSRGNNLNTVLIVDLPPAGSDAVTTQLQILDDNARPLATVSGSGQDALRACYLIGPATNKWQRWGVLVTTTGIADLTWQNDLDPNRPTVTYGPIRATLAQTRTGPGFTGQTDPCKETQ